MVLARNGDIKKSFGARLVALVFALVVFSASLYTIFSYFGAQKTGATDWYNYSWTYRKSITIDHNQISASQTDYPLLLSLASDSDLALRAQSDGDDILFTSTDGTTKLSHEIEKFDETTGELLAFVKVPDLSSTEDSTIYIYYANSTCSSQQNASGVWGSSFALVQHMNESSGTFYDSTSNDNDATQYGGVTYQADGKIGKAVGINGAEDHLRISDDVSFDLSSNFSLSTWVKSKAVDSELIDISAIEIDDNAKGSTYPVDLDQDGSMDILSADTGAAEIIWYQNDGLENFSKHTLNSITNPYDIVTYDFDNDGDIDIAGTSQYNDVYVLENDGSENFTREDIYTLWNQGQRISLFDINSDGHMDILATSYYSNQWAWFAGDGAGNFTLGATVAATANTHSISAADIDDDGDIDAAVTGYGADDVLWYRNNGNENFTQINIDDVVDGPQTVYVVDLDKDGDQDIIAAADVSHRVYWYSNDGSENFSKIDLLGYVRNANHCMPIDMDNDGDIDILGGGGHRDTGIRWYENNGSESFVSHPLKYSVSGAGKPSPADIDSDGDLDVVGKFVYSTNIHSLYLWKNNGTGIFNKASQIFKNQNGFSAYIGAGGYIQVLLSDADQDQCKLTSAMTIDDDTMHHLSITWDTTNLKIYIDGTLDASTTCTGVGSLNNTNYPTIGRGADSIFDEFRLSSSLYDQDAVTLNYNNQNSPSSFISLGEQVKGDQTDPENPATFNAYDSSSKSSELESENWYGHDNPHFEWGAGSDTQAGVAGYFVYFGTTSDANPVTLGAYQTGTTFTSSTTLTSGASHYLRIVTRDNAGNDSDPVTKFIYNYDGTPPEPPIYINVSPSGCSTKSTFTFTWDAATDTGGSEFSHYEYKKGSAGSIVNIGNVLTQTTTPYQEGDNIFYIRSVDNAGNISSWQTSVYCSTAVVSVVDGPSIIVGPSSINVTWTSSKQTTGYVRVYEENTYVSEQGHTQYSQSHNVRVVGLEPEKTYRYQLVWTDSGGNLGESDWYTTTTSSAPSVKNFNIQLINPSTVIASWSTSEASVASLQFGESAVTDNTIDISGSATSFSKELTSLKGGTAYQVRVVARSSDGYPFYYTTSFTTPPLPSIDSLQFESDTTQASPALSVSWETNVDTTSTIFYKEKGSSSYKETSSSDKSKNHKITISGLTDSTTYEIYAQGIDDYGNIARSAVNTVETPYDSRPPTISDVVTEASNVGVGQEDNAQIAVSWKTDEPASSKVEFGEGVSGKDYTQSTTEDPTQTNSHLVIVSGLKDSTPYHLRVCSKDKGGNQTCSDDSTVIPGEVQKSILSLILNTLQKAFGWLENII